MRGSARTNEPGRWGGAPGKREERPLSFAQAAGELRGWGGILR